MLLNSYQELLVLLQRAAVLHKPAIQPPLIKVHQQNRLQMGGGVGGWCRATMSQQDCDVSKEGAESRVAL